MPTGCEWHQWQCAYRDCPFGFDAVHWRLGERFTIWRQRLHAWRAHNVWPWRWWETTASFLFRGTHLVVTEHGNRYRASKAWWWVP